MGVFLSFDEMNRVLLIRFEGVITDEILLSRYRQVRTWIADRGPVSSISDFSEVEAFKVTARGVRQLAAQPPLVSDAYLRVVVAPQDEIFGMSRMFEILGSESRSAVHTVRSIDEAFRLTGIKSPHFGPVVDW